MRSIQTQTKLASVDQLNCKGCGNALSVLNPRAKYIACQYCGSVLDLSSEEHQILETIGKPEKHAPFSFLELGMIGNFEGRTYQLIARTRWRMKYKEYWYEEGESGYSNEVWIYDEWLMMDENKTYFYLVEDKTGYWVSEEIVPETPMLLDSSLAMQFYHGQPQRRVQEYGSAEVIFFEGESNYTIKKGDKIRFSTYKDRGIDYTAEWRMESESEVKEIEFFREVPVSRRKIIEAFGSNEQVEQLREDEGFWKFVYYGALIGALAMLVMGIASLATKGKVIFSDSVALSSIQDEGRLVGPLTMSEKDIHRVYLRVNEIRTNSEFYLLGYIMDQDSAVVNKVDGTYSFYQGYDSDGKWTEKDASSSIRFKVRQPGDYYVKLFADSAQDQPGSAVVELRKGGFMGRYFLIAMVIFLITALVSRRRYK